jgi:hypothetical protein
MEKVRPVPVKRKFITRRRPTFKELKPAYEEYKSHFKK